MAGASVVLAGIGGAGVAMVAWSRASHTRDITYVGVDSDAGSLAASGIARQILLPPNDGEKSGDGLNPASESALSRVISAGDICVVVAGLGGRTGAAGAFAAARLAIRQGCTVMCVAVLPQEEEDPDLRGRAERTLRQLARLGIVLFLLPLSRLDLALCSEDERKERTRELYEWIDRVVELATVPVPVNLVLRAAAHTPAGGATLGLYRRVLIEEQQIAKLAEQIALDGSLHVDQFNRARDVSAVVRAARPRPMLVAEVLAQISRLYPEDVAIDCIGRKAPFPGEKLGLELISFCPFPIGIGADFIRKPATFWSTLMPWVEEDAAPIAVAHRGLFGERIPVAPVSGPAAAIPAAAAAARVARTWRQLRENPDFADDGFLQWLDRAASECEAHVAAGFRHIRHNGAAWLDPGGLPSLRSVIAAPARVARAIASLPREAALRDWRTAVTAVGLLVAPIAMANLGLANLAAIGRANTLMSGEDVDVTDSFIGRDQRRLENARAATPVTKVEFSELGPGAFFPSALAARLDDWAAQEHFLQLNKFGSATSPYAFVNTADPQARGQVRLVAEFVRQNTKATALALSALGLFPDAARAERLAKTIGQEPSLIAREFDGFLPGPDVPSDIVRAAELVGCASIQTALDRRFQLKRLSPDQISLPYRFYVFQLALAGPGECNSDIQRAQAGIKTLEALRGIGYIRDVDGSEDSPTRVRYFVLTTPALVQPADTTTDLDTYISGLRAFYLLDFEVADALFTRLAVSANPVAASLGQYLAARSSFWRHEFMRGSYRPDQFSPWQNVDNESADGDGGLDVFDIASEDVASGKIPLCSAREADGVCLHATLNPAATPQERPFSPAQLARLQTIEERLRQAPFVDPSYIRQYREGSVTARTQQLDE